MDRTSLAPDWGQTTDWALQPTTFGNPNTWAVSARAPYMLTGPGQNLPGLDDRHQIPGEFFGNPYNQTSRWIASEIEGWAKETLGLGEWDTGLLNASGGAGDVSQNPNFGQFAQDPSVYKEIATAAQKYGIPANLLKVMIARESSGDWGSNNHATYLASRGERIVGYTGIMESTAKAWGYDFDQLVGNRALQIDAMANGLQRLYSQYGGQYGWDGVIAVYYSGDPTGVSTPSDSTQYGTTSEYLATVKDWWDQENAWTRANGGQVGGGGQAGLSSIDNAKWKPINQWDSMVAEAARQYNVPANLIKAVMSVESGGDANAASPAGATGLMQVMPGIHGLSAAQLRDPRANVMKGAEILRQNYDQYGTWEYATHAYLGGTPGSGASDGNNTQFTYWNQIQGLWQELDAAGSGVFGGASGDQGPTTTLDAIWGNYRNPDGSPVGTSQKNGDTNEWVQANPGMYDYSYDLLGHLGHPGDDWVIPGGTQLYSPVGGTVIIAGSSGSYGWYNSNAPQTGELRIRLDNGHELIMGHMSGIHVQAGQRITPGQYVGLSGGGGSGDHLHLEYRVPDSSHNGGWASVDPAGALGGLFTGSLSGNAAGPGSKPMTWKDVLKAAAKGEPTGWGQTLAQESNWTNALLAAMRGELPYLEPGKTAGTVQTGTGAVIHGGLGGNPFQPTL